MNKLILSIETSSKICSVGLLMNGKNMGSIEKSDNPFIKSEIKNNKLVN